MTDSSSSRSPGIAWLPWLMVLALLALLSGSWGSWGSDPSIDPEQDEGLIAVPDLGVDAVPAMASRVQGQVFIEIPLPPPAAVAKVVDRSPEALGGSAGMPEPDGMDDQTVGVEAETAVEAGTDAEAVDIGGMDAAGRDAEAGIDDEAGMDAAGMDDQGFDTGSAWPDSSEPDDGLAPPPEPPPVELASPPEGRCAVIAWQDGTQVSEPTPCEADGRFEVTLHPGRHGRTAFEVLVPGYLRAVLEVEVPPGGVGRLPAVALGEAVRVDGQVVDGEGEPKSGIVIEAMPSPNLGEPEPWRATSDDQGHFVFDTLPVGPVALRVQSPGYAVSVVEAIAPQPDVLITLHALMDLKGRVVGEPGALARAKVRIEGSGIWPVREHAVEADGHFVLERVPEGIYALEAVVEGGPGEPELASIPLENVTPELSLTLALVPAFRVPVEVRAPDGTPVADARVTLSNSSIGLLPRLAVTDPEGHVPMGPVVPGPYVLRAHADGFLPSPPIALTVSGPDTPLQVLTLAEPGRITGRVVDEEGYPVEDARVEMLAEHLFTVGEGQARTRFAQATLQAAGSLGVTTGPVPEVPTGDDAQADLGTSVRSGEGGRFSFDMLVPGEYRLQAHHGRHASSEREKVRLGAARTRAGVTLVLRTGHRLTGRVRDGNGRPVRDAQVRFDDGRVVYTNRRGLFDGGIRRGPQRLVARAAGLSPRALAVVVRDRPVDVEVTLGRARAELSGRIEGENGEPLANARVTLRTLDGLTPTRIAWTDDKGVYRFVDLPPGELEVEIEHPDHGPRVQQVELADDDAREELDLALFRGWSIVVEVVEEGTGEPLSGVQVVGAGARARTDADGRATLSHLSDERVRVDVQAEGLGSRRQWVERGSADERSVRLELPPGGGLQGRVIDYRGDPVPAVEVVVRDLDGAVLGRARTDGRGRWSVNGIAVGDVEVTAEPPVDREEELAPAQQGSDVLRGHVTRGVDLRFDRR